MKPSTVIREEISCCITAHFHLNCLVPGGVIADNGKAWVNSKDEFLFQVKALSKFFRGKIISYLEDAYNNR